MEHCPTAAPENMQIAPDRDLFISAPTPTSCPRVVSCNGFMSEFARIPHSALRNLGAQLVVMPPRRSKVRKSEGWVPLRSP